MSTFRKSKAKGKKGTNSTWRCQTHSFTNEDTEEAEVTGEVKAERKLYPRLGSLTGPLLTGVMNCVYSGETLKQSAQTYGLIR